jgi:nucleoside-diphosphate-sugar epimerase
VRAFVTGATGFIGGALAQALLEEGWEVSVLVRPGSRLRIGEHFQVVEGDLGGEISGLEQHLEGRDVVFHTAAIRDRYGTTRQEYERVNVLGTRRLLKAASGRVGRFVFVSSVGVFGYPGALNIDETFPLTGGNGRHSYHDSKAAAEKVIAQVLESSPARIETVIVRPTITYGPGDQDGMLTRLIYMIATGKFFRIGDGRNFIHLTYIADVVRALILAGTRPEAAGMDYILAGRAPIQAGKLVTQVENALGKPPTRFYIPEKAARACAYVMEAGCRLGAGAGLSFCQGTPLVTQSKIDTLCLNRGYSPARIQQDLGFTARVELAEGLASTIQWMVSDGLLHLPEHILRLLSAQIKSVS